MSQTTTPEKQLLGASSTAASSGSPKSPFKSWDDDDVASKYAEHANATPFLKNQAAYTVRLMCGTFEPEGWAFGTKPEANEKEESAPTTRIDDASSSGKKKSWKTNEELARSFPEGAVILDVGAGAGVHMAGCAPYLPKNCLYIGQDLDAPVLKHCVDNLVKAGVPAANIATIPGDATQLCKLLAENKTTNEWLFSEEGLQRPRVICWHGNTMGIIPEEFRGPILREMLSLVRPGIDRYSATCYHADSLSTAGWEFYSSVPVLTGAKVERQHFDFEKGTLFVPESGYHSQWWTIPSAIKAYAEAVAESNKKGEMRFTFFEQAHSLFQVGHRE